MPFLSAHERETLAHVCDTFVPRLLAEENEDELLFAFAAHDVDVAGQVEATVEAIAGADGQQRLKRFLAFIDSRLVNGFMTGLWDQFKELSLDERTKILYAWSNSRFSAARQSFQAIKRLTLFLAYASQTADATNPAWQINGYAGCANRHTFPDKSHDLCPLQLDGATKLDADVLIIGSGAGGGVVAAELSAAGLDVLVVEKGQYFVDSALPCSELDGMHKLYEKRGNQTTADMSMLVLAGSTVGGGTTVNWMTSLEPPPYVLEEWAKEFGFRAATGSDLQKSIDTVQQRLNVNTDSSLANAQNSALEKGCEALGYHCSAIPRNVKGCESCDYCGYGCIYGAKRDVRKTYLYDASQHGARILPRAQVVRVTHSGGKATGAEMVVEDDYGAKHDVTVQSKAVVVAAGSIHTPAILLRSGLANQNIGANLHLHPTTAVFGTHDEPINPWKGAPQTRVCDEFADLDGRGYGFRLEVCPAHPGLSALALPWQSGRDHKQLMQSLNRMNNIIILTRDKHSGRVKLNADGQPVPEYELNPYDANHLMRGVLEALRVQNAAGAREVFSPHSKVLRHECNGSAEFERFLNQVHELPLRPNSFLLCSAHQLSSCRIAGGPVSGAVKPTGETYEMRNLFVTDGSALPNACGVNPMITIMGLAHFLAQHIKSGLT